MATEIEPCLHDWSVYGLRFFAQEELLVLHAESAHLGPSQRFVDVEFRGVSAQALTRFHFQNVIADLSELDGNEFAAGWNELPASPRSDLRECFSDVAHAPDAEWLVRHRQRCFELSSSNGMHGFVIARDVRITPRAARLVPTP